MKSLKGSKTEKNLMASFAGESQARNRYTLFAKKAQEEGFEQIAALFLETAHNEYHHARRFFSFLEGGMVEIVAAYPAGVVGTTAENLLAAANGEHEEAHELYPKFAAVAKEEGYPEVAAAYSIIAKIEFEHEARYRKLLENVKKDMVFKKDDVNTWQCRACGYLHTGLEAPKICPACLEKQKEFELKCKNY